MELQTIRPIPSIQLPSLQPETTTPEPEGVEARQIPAAIWSIDSSTAVLREAVERLEERIDCLIPRKVPFVTEGPKTETVELAPLARQLYAVRDNIVSIRERVEALYEVIELN